jgi:hypothetical protein
MGVANARAMQQAMGRPNDIKLSMERFWAAPRLRCVLPQPKGRASDCSWASGSLLDKFEGMLSLNFLDIFCFFNQRIELLVSA